MNIKLCYCGPDCCPGIIVQINWALLTPRPKCLWEVNYVVILYITDKWIEREITKPPVNPMMSYIISDMILRLSPKRTPSFGFLSWCSKNDKHYIKKRMALKIIMMLLLCMWWVPRIDGFFACLIFLKGFNQSLWFWKAAWGMLTEAHVGTEMQSHAMYWIFWLEKGYI